MAIISTIWVCVSQSGVSPQVQGQLGQHSKFQGSYISCKPNRPKLSSLLCNRWLSRVLVIGVESCLAYLQYRALKFRKKYWPSIAVMEASALGPPFPTTTLFLNSRRRGSSPPHQVASAKYHCRLRTVFSPGVIPKAWS